MLDLDSRSGPLVGSSLARICRVIVASITTVSFGYRKRALPRYSDDLGACIFLAKVIDEIADGRFECADEFRSRRFFGTGTESFRRTSLESGVVVGAGCAQHLTYGAFGLSTIASSLFGAAWLARLCHPRRSFRIGPRRFLCRCILGRARGRFRGGRNGRRVVRLLATLGCGWARLLGCVVGSRRSTRCRCSARGGDARVFVGGSSGRVVFAKSFGTRCVGCTAVDVGAAGGRRIQRGGSWRRRVRCVLWMLQLMRRRAVWMGRRRHVDYSKRLGCCEGCAEAVVQGRACGLVAYLQLFDDGARSVASIF